MNLQEQVARVQKLTKHRYTKAELKQIHATVNEVTANLGQPKWAIEDEAERNELEEMIINYSLMKFFEVNK